jgi:hypothetical protein
MTILVPITIALFLDTWLHTARQLDVLDVGNLAILLMFFRFCSPWQCIASMCGFQSPRLGFFYYPDTSTPKQTKEKASIVVITMVEGMANFRDIEQEFNGFFSASFHCTARAISPSQFSMRFPNLK